MPLTSCVSLIFLISFAQTKEERATTVIEKGQIWSLEAQSNKLSIGNIVIHDRFGKGKVIYIEGVSDNQKAEILFEKAGTKKLLLRFSKLKIIA